MAKRRRNQKVSHEISLDLHGLTLEEAKREVDRSLRSLGNRTLKIITGKGRHTEFGRSVLAEEIPDYLKANYGNQLRWLDTPPMETVIDGVPIRGHFRVEWK